MIDWQGILVDLAVPSHICRLLQDFSAKLREPAVYAQVYGGIDYPNPKTRAERNEGFKKALEAFQVAIPEARAALEEEFRRLLGVSREEQ